MPPDRGSPSICERGSTGGKAAVAKMFVNNATGQRGLVCQYDVVCFDEISGASFDQKDGVNVLKGYMESGEFSRGKESIRAEGGVVMVGNLDADVEHQQRVGHLLGPLSADLRDDTAFMDRIHAYLPGWDFPKLNPNEHFTDHFGLVSDFLSECWSRLRAGSRVHYGGALSGRRTWPRSGGSAPASGGPIRAGPSCSTSCRCFWPRSPAPRRPAGTTRKRS